MSSQLVTRSRSFTVTSSTDAGASNISADGSHFDVEFATPIDIPRDSINARLLVDAATIWWTTPNIREGIVDTLTVFGPSTLDALQSWTVVIPPGLYSVSAINAYVQADLETQGAKIDPSPIITITGNSNTTRVDLTFGYTGSFANFTDPRNIGSVIGFTADTTPTVSDDQVVSGNQQVSISPLEFYVITASLVDNGIGFGDSLRQIIATVPVDVPVGHQILFRPPRTSPMTCRNMVGRQVRTASFNLLTDRLQPAATGGEVWSLSFTVLWEEHLRV